jgi:hypothetical protein
MEDIPGLEMVNLVLNLSYDEINVLGSFKIKGEFESDL